MNLPLFFSQRRYGVLVFIIGLLFVLPAHAGNIYFGLSLNENRISLTNQGNSTAFYPVVMRLLSDGSWEPLAPPPGVTPPAELLPGAQFEFAWPGTVAPSSSPALESFRSIMVRFFDQAGNGFGQISFFNQPVSGADLSKAEYVNGLMTITPPAGENGEAIRASWLLWPQEEGILPLTGPLDFLHRQPAARRIAWQPGTDNLRLDLGAGRPAAVLLHETTSGFVLQNLNSGGVQGVQQRASWLDAAFFFYLLAASVASIAVVLMLWHLPKVSRERSVA